MFLSYLDASGRPEYTEPENYCLASVTTSERNWQVLENKIKQIKFKHFPSLPDTEVEFHAKEMMNHEGIYKHLDWTIIYSIFDDIFNYVSDPETEIVIISTLIMKQNLRKKVDVETWAYRMLFERLNAYLERRNEQLLQAQFPPEYGIMITDSEGPKKDQNLRQKLFGMLRNGTLYSRLDYLIEDPLFTDSKWRNLSQLVDCIAFCIRRQFRSNPNNHHKPHWDKYYKQVITKFDTVNGNYRGYGLKIFP